MTDEKDAGFTPLTMEQIEAMIEEVIEANSIWSDPLPSQVSAVTDVLIEAMAQAWDEGWQAGYDDYDQGTETPNPHRALPPGRESDQ